MAAEFIGSENFSKGLVTVIPAHLLEDGMTPSCQNVDFSESFGRLTKRKGHSELFAANAGNIKVTGLFEFVTADGTKKILASSNDDVYLVTGVGTWTSIHNNATLNGARVNFTTFNDLAIIVSENLTTQKYTGTGSSSALGGTPPSNVKYIEVHKGRVWMGNSSAGNSRLHYCSLDDPEDWTTTGADGAGFIDVGLDDGDVITGLCSIGQVLLVFKKWSTWALYGSGPSSFSIRKISSSVGCVSDRTIQKCETFAIFLGMDGVYSARPDGVALLSYNIKNTIDGLTEAVKLDAASGKLRSQYWLCIDTDSDGKNDTVYVLDYVYGVWGKYTNKDENIFYRRLDGTLISGGSDTDKIRLHDTTENDEGAAINMIWDTKEYHVDVWTNIKKLEDVFAVAAPITGKTVTVSHLIDGVVSGTTIAWSLTGTGTRDKVYLPGKHFPDGSYGRYCKLRFSNNETDANVKIYAYSIKVTVDERVER